MTYAQSQNASVAAFSPAPPAEPVAFSAAALAKRWHCSAAHIYGMIHSGQIRAFKIGALFRISRIEVERIEKCGLSSQEDIGQFTGAKTAPRGAYPCVLPTAVLPNNA